MGQFRFNVSDTLGVDPRVWQTAYITGIEGVPWHCQHSIESDQFIIMREIDESGKVNIVWSTRAVGNVCLSTSSLRERHEPYGLAVELARGTVGRLQWQTAEWQRIGLKVPDEFFPLAEESLRTFLRSVTFSREIRQQENLAGQSIELALKASNLLCQAFAEQALTGRRQNEDGPLTTLLGVSLPSQIDLSTYSDKLRSSFNVFNVKPDFGQVERSSGLSSFSEFDAQVQWATEHQLKLILGPLVDFRPSRFPQWMVLLGEDYKSILNAACRHAEKVVERYRGKAHIWNCAVGLNSPSSMHWSDEEVLRMAVAVVSTVRQADKRTPVVLTVEQPWGEYLREHAGGISPIHFADALIRADLGISGLALELSFDAWPGGSFFRDLIDVSRLVDRWAMLGMPLIIYVTSPTDAATRSGSRVSDWRSSRDSNSSEFVPSDLGYEPGCLPPEALVAMLLSKPSIHAVIWDQLSDKYPGATPSSGLWDGSGRPKELLTELSELRGRFL